MGRLGKLRFPKRSSKTLIVLVALTIGTLLFFYYSDIDQPTVGELEAYLKTNSLIVGTDVPGEEFQQIYYWYEGKRQIITDGPTNHFNPLTSGRYIAWQETPDGGNQQIVVLYDVLTQARTQLSFYGSSGGLALDQDHVAWEDKTGKTSRIMLYDGHRIRQISGELTSLHPAVNGDKVAFVEYVDTGNCRIQEYDAVTGKTSTVADCLRENAWPRYDGDRLLFESP